MTPVVLRELGLKRSRVRYRILEELEGKGYTLTRIANELGFKLPAVSRVVNGHGHSAQILEKLRAVGVSEKYIFDPHKNKEIEQCQQ